MIDHCCDANRLFDAKEANQQARAFRKRGVRGATKKLITLMKPRLQRGDRLLDIGGGIGAIGLELKELERYTSVDASAAYQKAAQQLFAEQNWPGHRLNFVNGDFVEVAGRLNPHDHVSLDKVICCYPDVQNLLQGAARLCNKQLALAYPITGWVPEIFRKLANVYFRIRRSAFRTYLHKPDKVAEILEAEGFYRSEYTTKLLWRLEIWQRTS